MLQSWTVALSLSLSALVNAQRGDPCHPIPCGPNMNCTLSVLGIAFCRCKPGYFPSPSTIAGCQKSPCEENPCGTNALCESNGRAVVCKCVTGYTGDPFTGCSPSTSGHVTLGPRDSVSVYNSSSSSASSSVGNDYYSDYNSNNFGSSRNTDDDPCNPKPCGHNTNCEVNLHGIAICKCTPGYFPNPTTIDGCRQDPEDCSNFPCGSNAECIIHANRPVCACRSGHEGDPLNGCKRSECKDNAACPSDNVCHQFRCINPCKSTCGVNAECNVRNHVTVCSCPRGYTGDPFKRCTSSSTLIRRDLEGRNPTDLCSPTPCGANTNCHAENNLAVCSCKENYIGNAIKGCTLECERDSECDSGKGCKNNRCVDPCLFDCGLYADCRVSNHRAVCTCPKNLLGDGYNGCYPECIIHEDCTSTNRSCFDHKCVNPCDGVCGTGAECEVRNHEAICKCPKGYFGHPFDECRPLKPEDLCNPNPCGENADCKPSKDRENNDRTVCLCRKGYLGDPLVSCRRGDCLGHGECNANQACFGYKCINPCNDDNGRSICGTGADCDARNHLANCICPKGYTGDAMTECRPSGQRIRQ